MTAYDVTCPHCGHMNIGIYLEDTDGWMECEKCDHLHQFTEFAREVQIPVYRMDNMPKEILNRTQAAS